MLGRPVAPDEFAVLDEEFHAVYHAGLAEVGLATDAVAAMAAWGGSQSLLSMYVHDDLVALLGRHGIADAFARVDGLRALVGDTVDDAAAARDVGAAVVLYDGGITDTGRLRATGAPVAATLLEAVTLAADLVGAVA